MPSPVFKEARNVHCHSVDRSTIDDIDLNNLLSAYNKHVGSRSTNAHREQMERDSMVNDNSFIQKDAQRALPLR